jgi:hypothetical protein
MFDVFEQPWTLVGAGVLVLFGMLTFRSVWPEKRHWWQLALPAFIVAAAFGTDRLVQTDREKIHSLLKQGVKAMEREDCDAIATIVADDYHDSYHDSKRHLLAHCVTELKRSPVLRVKKGSVFIKSSPPDGMAVLIGTIKFDQNSYVAKTYKDWVIVKARIYLRKQVDKSWLINRIEVLEIDRTSVNWQSVR